MTEMDPPPGVLPVVEEAASAERWDTLADAFAAYRLPLENLTFIRPLADAVGISHYDGIQTRGYIKGVRKAGGRILHIHYGYTGGITSEADIVEALGDVDRGTWDGKEWWVTHPINKLREGGSASNRSTQREYGVCSNCFTALPATGICDHCQ
jgi:hypothetical protein